jgi:hypothetical protein
VGVQLLERRRVGHVVLPKGAWTGGWRGTEGWAPCRAASPMQSAVSSVHCELHLHIGAGASMFTGAAESASVSKLKARASRSAAPDSTSLSSWGGRVLIAASSASCNLGADPRST